MADIITAMGTAFSTIQGDILDIFAVVVPAVLVVIGVGLTVRLGIKYFKSLSRGA